MPDFQTSDGLTLFYRDEGLGPPILCLAGLTRNSLDFEFLAPHLLKYRLIRLDYRGRGASDYDPDVKNYNILREGLDAIELLDHLGIESATVIGTSRGGLVAMALSRDHGHRMNGVILNDIGPEVSHVGLDRIKKLVGQDFDLPDLKSAAEAALRSAKDVFPGVPLRRWHQQAGYLWQPQKGGGLKVRYDKNLSKTLRGEAAVGLGVDLWELFDGLSEHQVAVLRGENSDLLTEDTVARMRERHPGLLAVTIPDRGHVPFLDEPAALKAITEILERCA